MPTLKQVNKYHKKKKYVPKIIHRATGKHEIIYGARALNKQLPSHLDVATDDYDIFSPTPKVDANQTEKKLDKFMGFNAFKVEPAQHEGTYKVKSNVTGKGVADYTKPENKIPFRIIDKKKYIKLDYVKEHIGKTLKDPEAKYRWEKDRDALNRIRIYEKLKKMRRQRKPRKVGVRLLESQIFKIARGSM